MLLATTASALPSIGVSTAEGAGADAYVSGWVSGAAGDSGSSNNSGLWCRKATDQENQVVALRFDLISHPPAGYTTFSIDIINYRTNASPKSLAFYAVRDGAVGEDNDGTAPGYTDNNWDENSILFSTMPGLHWANTSTADQGPNADAIYLGTIDASVMVTNKGQINSFRSAALNDFMLTNADDLVTFLIVGANQDEAGSNYLIRVGSKELNALDSGAPTNVAGTFAPRLVYDPPASCVDPITLQNPTSQTGNIGSTTTFTSWFGYDATTTFKWQVSADGGSSWSDIVGANSDRYTTPTLVASDSGKQYRCIAMGCSSSVTNAAATLTVIGLDIWVGPASGGEWNTASSWSLGAAPSSSIINAFIGAGTNVSYNLPMSASIFGNLTDAGTLNINTNAFNSGAVLLNRPGNRAQININTNGVMTAAGNVALTSNSVVVVAGGGSLTASGSLIIGSNPTGGTSSGTPGSYGIVTNTGGGISVGSTTLNPGNASVSSSCLLVIAGGTNNLGSVTVKRSSAGSGGYNTLGTEGLLIYGGQVTMSGINVGGGNGNSFLTTLIAGGTVTNNGSVQINQGSSARGSRLLQTGGLFVVTNLVNPNPTASGSLNVYSVTGGTNIVDGIKFGTGSSVGNIYFTNGAVMYVGSQGISWDGSATLSSVTLSSGSLLGATADWTGSSPMQLGAGTATIQAANMGGLPYNITLSGVLSGSGALTKTGNGTLTLDAADTYSGNTIVNAGKLALGGGGSLANTPQLFVNSGATFDVTAPGGFTVQAGKSLAGMGSIAGYINFASTAILNPGSNTVTGTLTFSNSITETGGAVNHFDLSTNPSGPNNDLVVVQGDINVSGSGNVMEIVGGGSSGSVHPLFKYSGTLNGDLSSFTISGATGYLTNDTTTTPKTISLVVATAIRSNTNIVWVGNSGNNIWDILNTTNWLNASSLDYFVTGDSVKFDNTGLANPYVDIEASVLPASVIVNSSGDYVFIGAGSIGGLGGITKTNTGKLTIQINNAFSGGMNIKQGVVSVASLQPDNTPSPLGQTGTLLVDGGTLEYTGSATSWDRPLTVGTNGGTVSLPSGSDVTYSGAVGGSGSLIKADLGTLTLSTANSYSGGTRLNGGTLVLNQVSGAGTGDITFTGNSTLSIGAVKPDNTIVLSNYSGTIMGGNSGGLTGIKNIVGSSNLVVAVTTGVFDLTGNMSSYSGSITLSNAGGGIVRFNGATGSALATWDLGESSMDLNIRSGSTINYFGALKGGPSTTLSGRGGSSNNGPTTNMIGGNGISTIFEGIIQNGAGGSSSLTHIVKTGTGTLTLAGASTYTGTTTISNGVLALGNGVTDGSISSTSNINLIAGAFLDVSGRGDQNLSLGSSQMLRGGGTIRGSLDNYGGGTIAPGDGISGNLGTLTVTNAIGLGATTWIKLNRSTSPNSDRLVSSLSSISLGGTLVVTNVGASLQAGDTFTLFSAALPLNGSFSGNVVLPNYYTWNTSNLEINGTIQVTAVMPPALTNVDFSTLSSGTITLNAVNGLPNGPVTVQTTTNLLSNWTTVSTTTFDGSGNLSLPVTVNPTAPQSYFRLLAN